MLKFKVVRYWDTYPDKIVATCDTEEEAEKIRKEYLRNRKPMSDSAPYAEHMKEDIRLLLGCDGIVVPNRWRCSKGCETERRVADACGIPVVGVIGEMHDLQITNAI